MTTTAATLVVARVDAPCRGVRRLIFEDEASVDVPEVCDKLFEAGDGVRVEVGATSGDCVLRGTVYDRTERFAFVSCGGLLAKLSRATVADDADGLLVSLTKSRRRRRT